MQLNSIQPSHSALLHRAASTSNAAPMEKPESRWSRPPMQQASGAGATPSNFDFGAHDFSHLKLGKQLHKDLFMTVHDVPGQNATLIQMNPNMGPLSWVLEDLSRMQKAGIPTASVQQCGRRDDTDCALVQPFAQVHDMSTSGARKLVASNLTNQRTLNSLCDIRNGIEKENIHLGAPRLGMDASGAVRVLASGGLFEPGQGPGNKAQLRQFDAMISAVQAKLNGAHQQA